jgi:DNA transformation protein
MSDIEHYLELLKPLAKFGLLRARKMFGGFGIYLDDRMFGLVADQLYLKVDAQTRPQFEAEGSRPFVYEGKGKPVSMSYYTVPDHCLDDPSQMLPFARLAFEAAGRQTRPSRPRSKPQSNAPDPARIAKDKRRTD